MAKRFNGVYEIRDYFYKKIDEMVFDAFIDVQDDVEIDDGGCVPPLEVALEERQKALANAMAMVIAYQTINCEKTLDGVADILANDIPVFLDEVKDYD